MLKTNTLRAKFLLSFVVISLAYIVISSFFILKIVNSANNRMAKASFARWASDFETMAEPNFIYFNYMNLKAQAEEILKGNTCDFIVLFDAEDKEIFFKGPDWIRADLEPFRADGNERVLEVPFVDLIALPAVQAARVAAFLGGGLDVHAMAQAVDVRLYRHRRC